MEENMPVIMPALALRGLTVFPNMLLHFDVGRESSIKALDEAMTSGQTIFLVAQRELAVENPQEGDLYAVGTISNVRQILRLPGDNVRVMVEGVSRGRLCQLVETNPYLSAEVEEIPGEAPVKRSARTEALIRQTYELFETYIELAPKMTPDILLSVLSSEDPGYIADYIAQNLPMRTGDKQAILEELRPVRRLEKLCQNLRREVEILELEQEMQGKVRDQLTRSQRDYVLREQLKVLQHELGEDQQGGDQELYDYRRQIEKAKLPVEVKEKLEKELRRLEKQPFGSAEATVLRNYLDTVLELPWGKKTKERVNVAAARKTLDADHFGLEKVKTRILEFLAVKQLAPQLKGQILCLVGPPGVGKTSIASSVAKAIHRNMARISLGGVHDEAEIRGHRKTYVGAMPGRIIAAIRQAGSCNPLLLLDEIDKLGNDQRGDPASALLEVLDGEQNATFRDHFLEVPFDLSDVLFITTANTLDTIPRPLLDRMEVIELTSYTDEEKLQIAKRHLLPKELKRHGLSRAQLKVSDDAIRSLIRGYTREAGVRVLERQLGALCRKAAMRVVSDGVKSVHITAENLETYLGIPRYHPDRLPRTEQVGVVNGLAWTSVGGEILEVEVGVVPGTGKIELTGNLGDVMKESAHAALTYIRSRAHQLGIDEEFYKTKDIHIHFPEGAVPKDGPSAGIAITTAMVSALTEIPVRRDLAMTGEVTLRGRVLPIGGLKEKTMAAYRNGIRTVLLPVDNEKDLEEIDQTVRAGLRFVTVEQVDAVLAEALALELAPGNKELQHPMGEGTHCAERPGLTQ
ncbi:MULTISPECIES: endopeptidase La [Oscillospiraceae]|uniref:endopeptidase La n=1 Tax=Oscillospiraceae TaxID=216572 RepID=UPI000B39B022|nr:MULTISPECIES: endopeptidase La [Oscillospiraceae]MBM6884533.1 endopeptidase La [Pseudoflavonifractor phocaeensis]OUO42612.1 endopeptidase La [Flavonifractor sp. An306]